MALALSPMTSATAHLPSARRHPAGTRIVLVRPSDRFVPKLQVCRPISDHQIDSTRTALFENVLVSRLESALGHDIHMSTKDSFEFVAQVENIEQRTPRCESHQEVDVARVGVITPGRRSEHGESQAPMTFDGRLNLGARTPVAEDSREP